MIRKTYISSLKSVAVTGLLLMLVSCGGGFTGTLRGLLAASPAFFDSLQLGGDRAAVVQDFTDLSNGAITLGDELKACGSDKPCKVAAIDRYQGRFWDVLRRGHFKLSPKLDRVQRAIQGVIDAARIFYGGGLGAKGQSTAAGSTPARASTDADLKASLDELRNALQP